MKLTVEPFVWPLGVPDNTGRYALVCRAQGRLITEFNQGRGLSSGKRRGYVKNWRRRILTVNRELCRLRAVLFPPVELPDGVVPPAWTAKMNGRADKSQDARLARHPCLVVPDDFKAVRAVDPKEDYNTYAEEDVGADRVNVDSATQLTVTDIDQDENVWVVRDRGAGYFNGNFEHLVDHRLTASGPGDSWGACCSWALSDTLDSPRAAGNGVHVRFGGTADPATWTTYLQHYEGGLQQFNDQTAGGIPGAAWDYLTIGRVGSTLTCEIYNAATRINPGDLEDTLVIDDDGDARQYLFAMCAYVSGNTGREMSIVVANLDLQEGIARPKVNATLAHGRVGLVR